MILRTENHNGVNINYLDFNGLENQPKFSFKPIYRGQSVFIMKHCKQEGIKADFQSGEVVIYAKRKIDKFAHIILQSFHIASNPQCVDFTSESQRFMIGRKFIALGLKTNDTLYTTEDAFKDMVYYQFLGKVPVTKKYMVFTTLRELKRHLEKEQRILV